MPHVHIGVLQGGAGIVVSVGGQVFCQILVGVLHRVHQGTVVGGGIGVDPGKVLVGLPADAGAEVGLDQILCGVKAVLHRLVVQGAEILLQGILVLLGHGEAGLLALGVQGAHLGEILHGALDEILLPGLALHKGVLLRQGDVLVDADHHGIVAVHQVIILGPVVDLQGGVVQLQVANLGYHGAHALGFGGDAVLGVDNLGVGGGRIAHLGGDKLGRRGGFVGCAGGNSGRAGVSRRLGSRGGGGRIGLRIVVLAAADKHTGKQSGNQQQGRQFAHYIHGCKTHFLWNTAILSYLSA